MNKSIENDFDNDGEYKGLFAKKIYLYVLGKLVKEKTWSIEDCKDKAYDITMEAIARILEKESKGIEIRDRYAYLMEIVKNVLVNKKFNFHKKIARNSSLGAVGIQNDLTSTGDGMSKQVQVIYRVASITDAYSMYDFSTMQIFTPEQKAVIDLLDAGFNGKEISCKMGKSESTISRIIANIRSKTDHGKP